MQPPTPSGTSPEDDHRYTSPLSFFTNAWIRASSHATTSIVEANRAALAAFSDPDSVEEGVDSVAYSSPDWILERTVSTPENITVGDRVEFTKTFTDDDVAAFANASGDTNRVHLDDDYATNTRFDRRIVHGTLVSGLISAALARLPGVSIYLSQDLDFKNPVPVGTRVTAAVEVLEAIDEDRYRLNTEVQDSDTTYVTGEAIILIDPHPPQAPDDN